MMKNLKLKAIKVITAAILVTMFVIGAPESSEGVTITLNDCKRVLWVSKGAVVYVSKDSTKIKLFKGEKPTVNCFFENKEGELK
jgi:hypothetical protein